MASVKAIEKELSVDCEVIDLCSLNPIDFDTIKKSISKTKRVVVVEEDHKTGGYGAQIISYVSEELFFSLDAPPLRIAGEDVPIPYNRTLELSSIPTPESITERIVKWGRKNGL